jgi:hypothetical protein
MPQTSLGFGRVRVFFDKGFLRGFFFFRQERRSFLRRERIKTYVTGAKNEPAAAGRKKDKQKEGL